jgi:FlaA1/EpsC-like NDP-sugar epimerase
MFFKLISGLKILPRWIIVIIDVTLILISSLIAYSLRFNFDVSELYRVNFLYGVALFTLAGVISILATRSYQGIIRYTNMEDSIRIFGTCTIITLIALVFQLIYFGVLHLFFLPVSVLLISYAISIIFLVSYRVLVKYLFTYYTQNFKKKSNIILFGAGNSGRITQQILEHDKGSRFKVIAFLDDDPNKIGKKINGLKIYSAKKRLETTFEELNIHELIICAQNLSLDRKNEIVKKSLKRKIKIRTVPPADQWVEGTFSLRQIKDLRVEDLLGRAPISLKDANIGRELKGKSILVTGAAGSIGSEITRQVLEYDIRNIIMVDQAETSLFDLEEELKQKFKSSSDKMNFVLADIRNLERMEKIFLHYQPNIVFHAAAYKHVPMVEAHPYEAIQCNIKGTMQIADLSAKFKVEKFVMISTDKAVNPTNVMGASKRVAEIYVQSLNNFMRSSQSELNTQFITTRFGNVLGSNGSVIPTFRKQIEKGGPLTVTHKEVTRYFMTIPEACQLVLEAGSMGKGGEIFMFDMGKPIKIVDLAKLMIKLYGLSEEDIKIEFTGLRPGEKIKEELLTSEEKSLPTYHSKITIVQVTEYDYLEVHRILIELVSDPRADEFELVSKMKSLVPEFKSNVSRFSALDSSRSSAIAN